MGEPGAGAGRSYRMEPRPAFFLLASLTFLAALAALLLLTSPHAQHHGGGHGLVALVAVGFLGWLTVWAHRNGLSLGWALTPRRR